MSRDGTAWTDSEAAAIDRLVDLLRRWAKDAAGARVMAEDLMLAYRGGAAGFPARMRLVQKWIDEIDLAVIGNRSAPLLRVATARGLRLSRYVKAIDEARAGDPRRLQAMLLTYQPLRAADFELLANYVGAQSGRSANIEIHARAFDAERQLDWERALTGRARISRTAREMVYRFVCDLDPEATRDDDDEEKLAMVAQVRDLLERGRHRKRQRQYRRRSS
jgi:hypothetical protein